MEKPSTIREILGFSQKELAMVLSLDRTQINKFELGKRDLPMAAKYLLAELLKVAQSPELSAKRLHVLEQQFFQKQQLVERLLKENQYQMEVMLRKITAAEKKYHGNVKALQMVAYLNNTPSDQHSISPTVLNAINRRASQGLENEGLSKMFQYKMKYELLVSENMQLQAELLKHYRSIEIVETE
ncbi:helix-turn-helix domain-containing protein [Flavobacterium terrisoli]|uniref:helix-turn-helix domain-containing protein n=1 Tax=Flavobacterium terrisoli TaxID=3242195 RepID=UPI002543A713|nr:helix-turn-helix transcriptional regulator [Flavobacterium buctense]